ncbi:MAG: sel1 repeat family protein [Deltaproteobacteria bacterium]|nr:sel1 repeat family protein [Deltaproteobacteria bacterium]
MYKNDYGVGQNHNEAVRWYTKAATQRHSGAQYNFDVTYFSTKDIGRTTSEQPKKSQSSRYQRWG